MLSLSSGAPGCGKSSQHVYLCKVLPDSLYLCMEPKDVEVLETSGVPYKIITKLNDDYLEDPVATLAEFQLTIHDIIKNNKYKNVVIDGVSDIRKYATAEWIWKDNQDRLRKQMKPRESIAGENKGAWADINDRVKGILRPLINWANVTRNNVFFTAQLKDEYLNDKKVGKAINIGEWCEYDVDCKFTFEHPALEKYIIKVTKLPRWANDTGIYESTSILDVGFLTVLSERGLLKERKAV
jgi:hypothetical protein